MNIMPRVMPVRGQTIEQRAFRMGRRRRCPVRRRRGSPARRPCGVVATISIRIRIFLLVVILVDNSIDRITIASVVVIVVAVNSGMVSVVLLQRPIGYGHPMIRIANGTNVHPLRS